MRLSPAIVWILSLLVPVAADPPETATCPIFVLRHAPGGIVLETEQIPDGEVRVFPSNAGTGIIDIILPPGPGGSAGLERPADGRLIIARYADGRLTVTTRLPDGKEYARPARELADLRQFDVRVSVSAHDGSRTAFVIRGYNAVAPDDLGPVVDLFGGKVPLSPGDYLVSTDTARRSEGLVGLAGEVSLEYLASPRADGGGYLIAKAPRPDGSLADFIVDLAAGQTIVSQAMLPAGAGIEPGAMIEHSAAGTRELKYKIGGATGDVQNILGFTTLPTLRLGTVDFADARVLVMPSLLKIGDRTIDGILGVDLLRQAARVAILSPRGDRPARLILGADPSDEHPDAIRSPFSTVAGHLFIRCEVAGTLVAFVLDTGSPTCFLDPDAAAAAGVSGDASRGRTVRGLDGGQTTVLPATLDTLTIAGRPVRGLPIEIGRLPVLEQVRSGQYVGLLGNTFFARFSRVEIDFQSETVRFVP